MAAADPSAESPGESWLRLALEALGYRVLTQHPLRDEQPHSSHLMPLRYG